MYFSVPLKASLRGNYYNFNIS
uniref:Uncharacterized protein n=1 Tax=Anguilla anguilla TaxID=7936 RepID=A0A0E9TZ62_ANGAN